MAGSLNKVTLIGNLGRDPEIRSVGSGSRVANFSVATTESWRDKRTGEWVNKTEWHNVVVWNEGTVNYIEKNIFKGDTVYIEGKLETREYQDKDGNTKRTTEVVIKPFNGQVISLTPKKDGGGRDDGDDRGSRGRDDRGGGRDDRGGGGRGRDDGGRSSGGRGGRSTSDAIDDDIPF